MIQNVELQTPRPGRHSWPRFSGLVDAGSEFKGHKWSKHTNKNGGGGKGARKGPSSSKEKEASLGRCF